MQNPSQISNKIININKPKGWRLTGGEDENRRSHGEEVENRRRKGGEVENGRRIGGEVENRRRTGGELRRRNRLRRGRLAEFREKREMRFF